MAKRTRPPKNRMILMQSGRSLGKSTANQTMIWDNKADLKLKCHIAAKQLKAKPEHYIVLLKDFYSCSRRDSKGNLIKPTVATKLRDQGFFVRLIFTESEIAYHPYSYFRVVHIRTQERLNYFKLLFANEMEYCLDVKDI